jgi:tetratricopeptide (TPR) repeat protein
MKSVFFDNQTLLITPWGISWLAAVEILKNPLTALFGAGVGNFPAVFTQVKTVSYNMSDLWQITSFTVSRSAVLHILTEGGLIAFIGFLMVFVKVYETFKNASLFAKVIVVYAFFSLLFWPPSLINFFVFFFSLAYYAYDINRHNTSDSSIFDFGKVMPLYITSIVVSLVVLVAVAFFVTNAFVAEVFYGNSVHAVQKNSLKSLYDNQRRAIGFNPYNEEFRRDFAQTNLLIANNFAAKKPEEISEQDRQIITQAIQSAIAEAKAAVSLNSQNAVNWQHLANIYKNILNVAEGADQWTMAAYQRSIMLDPQNPIHRLELGGVFFLAQNYSQAERLFEQSANLKPDWSNAYYNLAWSKYKQGKFEEAAFNMQQVVSLLDAEKDKADLEKAQKDLEEFKKQIKNKGEQEKKIQQGGQSELNLPSEEKQDEMEPKIELPDDVAPPEEGQEEEVDINPDNSVNLEGLDGEEATQQGGDAQIDEQDVVEDGQDTDDANSDEAAADNAETATGEAGLNQQ